MGSHSSMTLNFNGILVRVLSEHPEFSHYIERHFHRVLTAEGKDPHVSVRVVWRKKGIRPDKGAGVLIGGNTVFEEQRVSTIRKINRRKKVCLDFRLVGERLFLDAVVSHDALKDFLRYKIGRQAQEPLFFDLTYPLIYYPLFWYLEAFRDTHVLHASAVTVGARTMVMCGLEGMGKTSTALSLLDTPGTKFFSDNLIFHDPRHIFPCFEPVRIHKGEDPALWQGKFSKIDAFRSLKDFFEPCQQIAVGSGRPDIFILPAFGPEFSVREVSRDRFLRRLINLNQLTAELGQYNEYAALMSLLAPDLGLYEARHRSLQSLLSHARCFFVVMRKSDGIRANVDRLKELILDGQGKA